MSHVVKIILSNKEYQLSTAKQRINEHIKELEVWIRNIFKCCQELIKIYFMPCGSTENAVRYVKAIRLHPFPYNLLLVCLYVFMLYLQNDFCHKHYARIIKIYYNCNHKGFRETR